MIAMHRHLALVLLAVCCSVATTGCGKNLFAESPSRDSARRAQIDKYWGGDSALETTANRRRAGDMGFGFPGSPSN